MALSSTFDDRGFIRLTLDGPWPAMSEFVTLQRSLGEVRTMRRVLIDVSKTTGPLPKFQDIREIVTGLDTESPATQTRRRAVVVSSDVQFGVARTFQAILPGETEVFRDEASALVWLLAGA